MFPPGVSSFDSAVIPFTSRHSGALYHSFRWCIGFASSQHRAEKWNNLLGQPLVWVSGSWHSADARYCAPSPRPRCSPACESLPFVLSMPLLVRRADMKFHECDQCKELFPTPALLQVHIKCQHSGRCPRGAPGQGGPGCFPPRALTAAQPRPRDSRVVPQLQHRADGTAYLAGQL